MSNPVHIEVNCINEKKYLITVADNYASGMFTTDKNLGGLEILQHCVDFGSDENAEVCGVIDFVLEHQGGVNINGIFYDWDEIKHIFGME